MSNKKHTLDIVFKNGAECFDGSEAGIKAEKRSLLQKIARSIVSHIKVIEPTADISKCNGFTDGMGISRTGQAWDDAALPELVITSKPLNVAAIMAEDHGAQIFGHVDIHLQTRPYSHEGQDFGSRQTVTINAVDIHPPEA